MSARVERVATSELVERARRIAGQFTGGNLPLIPPSLLTALADRLAEYDDALARIESYEPLQPSPEMVADLKEIARKVRSSNV